MPRNSGSRKLTISPHAQKYLERQDATIQREIDEQIRRIREDPFVGKKLVGPLKGYWSCHVGGDASNLLIVYTIKKMQTHIVGIGTHKFYQKLSKQIRKMR